MRIGKEKLVIPAKKKDKNQKVGSYLGSLNLVQALGQFDFELHSARFEASNGFDWSSLLGTGGE
jgi:hypothetical protein